MDPCWYSRQDLGMMESFFIRRKSSPIKPSVVSTSQIATRQLNALKSNNSQVKYFVAARRFVYFISALSHLKVDFILCRSGNRRWYFTRPNVRPLLDRSIIFTGSHTTCKLFWIKIHPTRFSRKLADVINAVASSAPSKLSTCDSSRFPSGSM